MEIILSDARDAYAPEIVIELQSDTKDEIESNCQRIATWAKQWIVDNTHEGSDDEEDEEDEDEDIDDDQSEERDEEEEDED